MDLKAFARNKGRTLSQLGLHRAFASQLNTGVHQAGPKAIAAIAVALGEPTERVAEVLDACWQEGRKRRGQIGGVIRLDHGHEGQAKGVLPAIQPVGS